MQSLWSRAGQAHRCGCRICDTAVSTLGRRVTTAATRRRKPTLAEVFTAGYSSVLASAAVVDAIRKEDKRQELDRQLDEARQDLVAAQLLRSQETNRITESLRANRHFLTPDQNDALWNCLKENHFNFPYMREVKFPATVPVSSLISNIQRRLYHIPDEATMQAMRQTDYEFLERAIISEEMDPTLLERGAKTNQHLHHDGRTMVHLVRQLLKRARMNGDPREPSPTFDEARKLASTYQQGYTFSYMNHKRAIEIRRALNQRLREIVSSSTLGLKEMVGRVCYNLLVAAYPPDMHTFNTLIVAFDKAGLHNFSEAFVDSFLYRRRILPTPTTFIVVMQHYKNSGNHLRSILSIARLVGLDKWVGFKWGRRHIEDIEAWDMDYWRPARNRTQSGKWVYQHVPLSVALVETIIDTLLRYSLFDFAAKVFVTCMDANVPLGTRTIRRLFDECICALDWRAAVRLVRGFADHQHIQHDFPSMLLDQNDTYLISRVRVLVDICGLNFHGTMPPKSKLANLNISPSKFSRFLQGLNALSQADSTFRLETGSSNSGRQKLKREKAARASASRLLQIESLLKEQAMVYKDVTSIKSKLLYPDFSLNFRISMAIHVAEVATHHSVQLNRAFHEVHMWTSVRGLSQALLDDLAITSCKSKEFHDSMKLIGRSELEMSTQDWTTLQLPMEEQVSEKDLPGRKAEEGERGSWR
ncbi:hypothetical protein QQX98_003514 [Neonectria punicea]|uniref:Pentatricopeptide repeat domain-containing protein n=1 Tax=Neonectria punicea TaxID=979145 RepID=A0ABR1HDP3_9HYPO